MKELSLHILDIVQNSINAGAHAIIITINEDIPNDRLTISVEDDGCGMSSDIVEKVKDPFFTSRSTRRVGLGIPLLKAAADRCGGGLKIESEQGKGTTVTACFIHSHIDRAPIGNIWDTITGLIVCNEDVDFKYKHYFNGKYFEFDTLKIKEVLDGVPVASPEVVKWIGEYIKDGINELYGGAD